MAAIGKINAYLFEMRCFMRFDEASPHVCPHKTVDLLNVSLSYFNTKISQTLQSSCNLFSKLCFPSFLLPKRAMPSQMTFVQRLYSLHSTQKGCEHDLKFCQRNTQILPNYLKLSYVRNKSQNQSIWKFFWCNIFRYALVGAGNNSCIL